MAFSSFDDLIGIMKTLRAPNGCSWDREQTHESLLPYLIEESAEFVEAVQNGNAEQMCEELGDILLQIVFHASIAQERNAFSCEAVVRGICEKLVRRHPHVFGDAVASTPKAVEAQWERIKGLEKGQSEPNSLMDKVGSALPALSYSYEMERRAAKAGFDWPNAQGAADKVREEMQELEEAIVEGVTPKIKEEFGDLLLAVTNWGRKLGIHPELALVQANSKFRRRFVAMEKAAGGVEALKQMDLNSQEKLWQKQKNIGVDLG